MKFIGVYDYTVIITYLSLISGVSGMAFAFEGRIGTAILCLLISGICDMFDGVVARTKKNRTDDEKGFGIQLDSLCDIVCFGVLPAIILYFSGVREVWGIAILVFYILCGVIRLAFFNVLEAKRQASEEGANKTYRGLPVTSISILFPPVYFIGLLLPDAVFTVILHILLLTVAFLFVLDFKVKKISFLRAK